MIEIQKAQPADAEQIVELQIAMALESESLRLDKPTVTRGVSAVFDNPDRGTYWITRENDSILAVLLTIPEWSDWRNATVLWIHSLYVLPQARRRGIFKMMYLKLKNQVQESDHLAGLRLYVDKKNDPAKNTYEALGMDNNHYELYEWLK